MSKCVECDKELVSSSALTSGGSQFCGNLCRVLYERKLAAGLIKPEPKATDKRRFSLAKMLAVGLSFAVFSIAGSFVAGKVVNGIKSGKPSNVELNAIASELNTRLPMMLDNATQLKTSIAIDGRIRYVYKLVAMNADSINKPMLLEYIRNQASAMSCTTAETRALIDRNVDLEYWYTDRSDRFVLSYLLTKAECERLGN